MSPCKTDPLKPVLIYIHVVKIRFEGVKKKINNACYYVIQKSSMLFFPTINSINIYFKVGKIIFVNN